MGSSQTLGAGAGLSGRSDLNGEEAKKSLEKGSKGPKGGGALGRGQDEGSRGLLLVAWAGLSQPGRSWRGSFPPPNGTSGGRHPPQRVKRPDCSGPTTTTWRVQTPSCARR